MMIEKHSEVNALCLSSRLVIMASFVCRGARVFRAGINRPTLHYPVPRMVVPQLSLSCTHTLVSGLGACSLPSVAAPFHTWTHPLLMPHNPDITTSDESDYVSEHESGLIQLSESTDLFDLPSDEDLFQPVMSEEEHERQRATAVAADAQPEPKPSSTAFVDDVEEKSPPLPPWVAAAADETLREGEETRHALRMDEDHSQLMDKVAPEDRQCRGCGSTLQCQVWSGRCW